MTSDDVVASADVGLLSPVWAGTAVAAATGDRAVIRAMLDSEIALTRAEGELGIVPAATAELIAGFTDSFDADPVSLAERSRAGGNPVIPLVNDLREALARTDAEAARAIHLGATSQDILDSALMLVSQRCIRLILGDLDTTELALADLARSHRATPMAARTLTQHSVPSTFGLKAAGWLMAVSDARGFLSAVGEALPAQLGGAGGTLASFRELAPGRELDLVAKYSARLELQAPPMPWHTIRTPIVRIADALAGVAVALGKVAADVSMLSRPEIGELSEGTGGESSSMPQKQNPARSVLINSAARSAPGVAAELVRSAISIDERPDGAWHAEWQELRELLRLVGGAASLAAELLPGLAVHTVRMRENLELTGPLIVSERVNLVLGPVLGTAAVKAIVTASLDDPASLAARLHAVLPDWDEGRITELLDPLAYLGASDALIDRALAHAGHSG